MYILYTSIYIDGIHFCILEKILTCSYIVPRAVATHNTCRLRGSGCGQDIVTPSTDEPFVRPTVVIVPRPYSKMMWLESYS